MVLSDSPSESIKASESPSGHTTDVALRIEHSGTSETCRLDTLRGVLEHARDVGIDERESLSNTLETYGYRTGVFEHIRDVGQ